MPPVPGLATSLARSSASMLTRPYGSSKAAISSPSGCFAHDRCYIFQINDGRVLFAIPYERDFTLIGTTDLDYSGDPGAVVASEQEVEYLCAVASDYFRIPVTTRQVLWSYSGVRPLFDDGASAAQAATRDYVLKIDAQGDAPAMLNVFGGKLTTYRKLAESAIAMLAAHLPKPARPGGWTAKASLPGGDFPVRASRRSSRTCKRATALSTRT